MWNQISLGPPVAQVRGKNVQYVSDFMFNLASNHRPSGVSLVLLIPLEVCPRISFSSCNVIVLCACPHHLVLKILTNMVPEFWLHSHVLRLQPIKDCYSITYSCTTTGIWSYSISWSYWRCASFGDMHTICTKYCFWQDILLRRDSHEAHCALCTHHTRYVSHCDLYVHHELWTGIVTSSKSPPHFAFNTVLRHFVLHLCPHTRYEPLVKNVCT